MGRAPAGRVLGGRSRGDAEPAGTAPRRARTQGRRPLPRGARHEDPCSLPRRARAWRLSRAARRRLHEGLPAQLRALPRPRPGRRPAAVAARARRRQGTAGGHRGPAADRDAAPRPDVLAEHRRLRAADRSRVLAFGAYLAVQLLRFAKPPTIAVSDPATAVVAGRRGHRLLRPEGHLRPGCDDLDRHAGP